MVKAVLTKPLDGHPEGARREFDQPDFDRLKVMGAVRALTEAEDVEDAVSESAGEATSTDEAGASGEKAAPEVLNKAAPPVANKAEGEGAATAADIVRPERSGGRKADA